MPSTFIVTKEHRRFVEFANTVRTEHTIGICHGDAGVGKTNSVRRYAHWDTLGPYLDERPPRSEDDARHNAHANRSRTVFYTPDVLNKPRELIHDIERWQIRVGLCVEDHQRTLGKVTGSTTNVTRWTELIIIDEAERLTATGLELIRDHHDRTHIAIVLIGMPGIDQRFRHYPSSTAVSASHTATAPSAATNSSSSSTATGNASAKPSTPTTSPTPKPLPPSNASPAATSDSSNASSPKSNEYCGSTSLKPSPTT